MPSARTEPTAPRNPSPSRGTGAALGAAAAWALLLFLARRLAPDGREHSEFGQFLGRLHPLLVHLPVAFLVLVPLLELAGRWPRWAHLRAAAGAILVLASASALLAALDGWLLAWSGGYRGNGVTHHLWAGVLFTAVCAAAAWARGRTRVFYPPLLAAAVGLMIWTAHGGGSLSHGEGFLTDTMPAALRSLLGMPAVQKAAAATVSASAPAPKAGLRSVNPDHPAFYSVHVEPLFQRSCVSCHKPEKHKGGLRMDSYEQLMRGGDDGPAVIPGNPQKSDLVRRLHLPSSDDDSMPSDGDKPLTPEEIRTVERWIEAGAKSG